MTERELRLCIRKEIRLNEAAGDASAQDVMAILDSFADVFRVTKIAVKSLLSVLVLNVKLVFSADPAAREKALQQYQSRRAQVESEYDSVLGPAKKLIAEFEPLIFLANPGAYLGYAFFKGGAGDFADIREFLQQSGIDITSMRIPTGLGKGSGDEDDLAGLYGLFGGGTPNTEGALTKIYDQQKNLQASIDRIFGLARERMGEGILLEQKGESIEDQLKVFFDKVIAKAPPESFGIDKNAAKSVVELKLLQAAKFSKDLESPLKFTQKLSTAKSIEDVKAAIEILRDTSFVLKGFEKITPEYLDSASEKALDAAEKNNKLQDLFKEIGAEIPDDRKSRLSAVKAYQLRNLLGTTVISVKSDLIKQIESLRKSYLEIFKSDVDIEALKRIAPGSELQKVVEQGIQNIREAGKR